MNWTAFFMALFIPVGGLVVLLGLGAGLVALEDRLGGWALFIIIGGFVSLVFATIAGLTVE